VTAAFNGEVIFWDLTKGKATHTLETEDTYIYSLAYSPDDRFVVFAGYNIEKQGNPGEITLWDIAARKAVYRRNRHAGRIVAVMFRPDGKHFVARSADEISYWETKTGKELYSAPLSSHARHTIMSPDGERLASFDGSGWGTRIWTHDVRTGQLLWHVKDIRTSIGFISFTRNSKIVLSAHADDKLRHWDARTGKLLGTSPGPRLFPLNHCWLGLSPDGKFYATESARGFSFWDARTGIIRRELQPPRKGPESPPRALATCSGDWRWLAAAFSDEVVEVWDIKAILKD
jgi:WD40 repeat protein